MSGVPGAGVVTLRCRGLLTLTLFLLLSIDSARAHHGSAEYHVDREITISGTVTAWRWVQPHVRIVLSVAGKDGKPEEWDTEGPPLTWAAQQGWSPATFAVGERVSLVMYPLKQQSRGGLVKRIARASGEVIRVSRPWLEQE
jgi:hypothetical protein